MSEDCDVYFREVSVSRTELASHRVEGERRREGDGRDDREKRGKEMEAVSWEYISCMEVERFAQGVNLLDSCAKA